MPSSILASDACLACKAVVASVKASSAVHLVSGHGFSIMRRDRWLIIWDLTTGQPNAVRLELRQLKNERRSNASLRYRIKACHLWRLSRFWSILEATGLFDGCKSAYTRGGYIYLNRLVAAVGGLFTRDGHDSLSWFRQGDRTKNHVVHHRKGNSLDDRFTSLQVMWHDEHDKHHDHLEAAGKVLLPVATLLKVRSVPVPKLTIVGGNNLVEPDALPGEQKALDGLAEALTQEAVATVVDKGSKIVTNASTKGSTLGSPAPEPSPRYPYFMRLQGRRGSRRKARARLYAGLACRAPPP